MSHMHLLKILLQCTKTSETFCGFQIPDQSKLKKNLKELISNSTKLKDVNVLHKDCVHLVRNA